MKKSETVRVMIAAAKLAGRSPQDTVAAVVEALGFQRQLARAYVKNNWDRVEAPEPAPVEAEPEAEVHLPEAAVKPKRELSMSKDAIRKRAARARARAAQTAEAV